jgi:hypothetical protein
MAPLFVMEVATTQISSWLNMSFGFQKKSQKNMQQSTFN